MDQISGLMPQIGWSPLMMPATPKKAPATTVEPAGKSASAQGGMAADVGTQAGQDRAPQAHSSFDAATGGALQSALMPEPPPDPEAPTGPPPTFEVTPLEAMAAEQLAPPERVESPPTRTDDEPSETPGPRDAAPEPAPRETAPEPAPAQKPEGWSSLKAPEDPTVDITR